MRTHRFRAPFTLVTVLVLATVLALAALLSHGEERPASFRFERQAPRSPAAPSAVPLELTASDGSGLRLLDLDVRGVLEPPLAFTELRMTFENPEDRVREGRFRITLPPGAVLSRFAMKVGGHWQEGEVVERQRARRIYEDFLHRSQDPALLEHAAGNELTARVFPIPANGTKELVVSYSHALERSDEPYVVPLKGLPEIGRLDVRVLLGERPGGEGSASNLGGRSSDRRLVELHTEGWTPDQDLVVRQDEAAAGRSGLRHGNLAVLRLRPDVQAVPQEVDALYLLVDSSASRALGYDEEVELAATLIAALRDGAGPEVPLGVLAFDQDAAVIYEGPAASFGEEHRRRLLERGALGASDLQRALDYLAGRLAGDPHPQRFSRVLVLTDGVATAGETGGAELREAVRALGGAGVERLDVLAFGGLRDETLLRGLVTDNLEHDGQLLDVEMPLEEIARRLTLASRSDLEVEVKEALWVWPRKLDSVQPGDERLVYADLTGEGTPVVELGGRRVDFGGLRIDEVERPLLERAWVASRIERLLHLRETDFAGDRDLRSAVVREVTELSVRHRVLSPFTAFLVLETEADYERYQLDRTALGDILTVGLGGLEVVERRPPPPPEPFPMAKERIVAADGEAEPDSPLMIAAEPEAPPAELADPWALQPTLPGTQTDRIHVGEDEGVAEPEVSLPDGGDLVDNFGFAENADIEEHAPTLEVVEESRQAETEDEDEDVRELPGPYEGTYADVMADLAKGRPKQALRRAEEWRAGSPGDVLALLALGESCEAVGDAGRAARAYGSLIDLYPSRADLRRHAGERLAALGTPEALALALDTYAKAAGERPDHPSGHRLLAWALLRAGRPGDAFAALERALTEESRNRIGVAEALRGDLGLVAAAWLREEPGLEREIRDRLRRHGAVLAETPTLRFVLTWETDANDVDLHVFDAAGVHAYYSRPELASGGRLVADVTNGYGPECFVIDRPPSRRAYPYRLGAHYYSRGPMGFGPGTLQVVEHDGQGRITVEERPFVVMADDAYVELVEVRR